MVLNVVKYNNVKLKYDCRPVMSPRLYLPCGGFDFTLENLACVLVRDTKHYCD